MNPSFKENYPDNYEINVRCVDELFRLVRDYGEAGEQVELYSCSIDKEEQHKNKKLTRVIDMKSFTMDEGFGLEDRQYICIRL